MSTSATRPCPFCGEPIKASAVKCRFCGEFLDEDEEVEELRDKPKKKGPSTAKKWLVPVGRNIWSLLAGYFGIAALAPLPIIIWGFAEMTDVQKTDTKETLCYLGAALNGILGLMALVFGIIGIITLMGSEKSGMGRAIFGIVAGLLGGLGYILFVNQYWVPTYVKAKGPAVPVQRTPAGDPGKKP